MTRLGVGTVIRVREKNARGMRQLGKIVDAGDTFRSFERVESRHLFRGGRETLKEARRDGAAAWGLDLAIMEKLSAEHGVQFIEVPTSRHIYSARMEDLLGPKSFVVEYGGHRPQVMLTLEYWTKRDIR